MTTFCFHLCRATEWKFSPGFAFKVIFSSFLPHLHLDLLALLPSTTLSILHGWQGDHPIQRSLIHVRPRGRALAGKSRASSHGSRLGGRAHRQDTIGDHPCAGIEGGAEGCQSGSAEPLVRPNPHGGPSASHSLPRTVRKISAKSVPGFRRFCTSNDGDARTEGRLQAPLCRSASTNAARGGSGTCVFTVYKKWRCSI